MHLIVNRENREHVPFFFLQLEVSVKFLFSFKNVFVYRGGEREIDQFLLLLDGVCACQRETEKRRGESTFPKGNDHATSSSPFLPPTEILGMNIHTTGIFLKHHVWDLNHSVSHVGSSHLDHQTAGSPS